MNCDRLPIHVAVRWDGCIEDYTGTCKPGVLYLAPKEDDWDLPIDAVATINYPGAPRSKVVQLGNKKQVTIRVTRCQVPLTHEDDMTFQNAQGKTIRGPEGQPKGFVVDLHRSPGMHSG